jgi:transcriptional regulator with XRE-family HTH domain
MATGIGTRIKRARERKRWTQRQLADALGVDRKTVDNWENGRTRPASSIGAIEDVLGVSLSEDAGAPEVPRELEAYPDLVEDIRRRYPRPDDHGPMLEAIAATLRGDPPPTSPAEEDPSNGRRRAG